MEWGLRMGLREKTHPSLHTHTQSPTSFLYHTHHSAPVEHPSQPLCWETLPWQADLLGEVLSRFLWTCSLSHNVHLAHEKACTSVFPKSGHEGLFLWSLPFISSSGTSPYSLLPLGFSKLESGPNLWLQTPEDTGWLLPRTVCTHLCSHGDTPGMSRQALLSDKHHMSNILQGIECVYGEGGGHSVTLNPWEGEGKQNPDSFEK